MTNPKQDKPESEEAIMERMNKALKKMMETPHETQKEMIERRRRRIPSAVHKPKGANKR